MAGFAFAFDLFRFLTAFRLPLLVPLLTRFLCVEGLDFG